MGANGLALFDLLAPIHTGDSVLKVGGQYDSAPSSTGRTCIRILGNVQLFFNTTATAAFSVDDGAWVGIMKGAWTSDSASVEYIIPQAPAGASGWTHPYDPADAANTTDWAFWSRVSVFQDNLTTDMDWSGADTAAATAVITVPLDVRAKRALKEMGETMILCVRPSGDPSGTQGIERIDVTTSVLLR